MKIPLLRLQGLGIWQRTRAAGLHLLVSAFVASIAAVLVFGVWFPGIYRQLAGGSDLFVLLSSVDVVLGPMLTFAVFDLKKGWSHLRRDLGVIALIQIAALIYGMHTVYQARPIALVFEVDRLRVITAAQVYLPELEKASPEYRKLPLNGPWLLGTRSSANVEEHNDALLMGVGGVDIAQRASYWQPYEASSLQVLERARPLSILLSRYPSQQKPVLRALSEAHVDASGAKFLPVTAHSGDWVALLDGAGRPFHFLRVDGFF
jgi:hypothetical protein